MEEATQLRQRPSALEELHEKETVHTTTKLMQKATAEAEVRTPEIIDAHLPCLFHTNSAVL